jgi:transcriptional regulator with XRE-family HTH domain
MDGYYRDFGARVRSARGGITQGQLAAEAGLKRAAIANIELGRHRVTLDVLDRLAAALGVDPASLLPPVSTAQVAQRDSLPGNQRRAVDRVLVRANREQAGVNVKG